jgi:hypothetical protein
MAEYEQFVNLKAFSCDTKLYQDLKGSIELIC